MLAIAKAGEKNKFTIIRPNTGQSAMTKKANEIERNYIRVQNLKILMKKWNEVFEFAKSPYARGSRIRSIGIVTGCVVPLWAKIQGVFNCLPGLSRAQQTMKIVRANLDDNERIVGLLIPGEAIEALIDMTSSLPVKSVGVSEYPTPINSSAMKRCVQKEANIYTFFGGKGGSQNKPCPKVSKFSGERKNAQTVRKSGNIATKTRLKGRPATNNSRSKRTSQPFNFFSSVKKQRNSAVVKEKELEVIDIDVI
mmetsp:Transcript_1340/g.1463  ORF Transcript_1340/g.1463 Transcript_1340/m.1463 type:complete len:252 (+) Transcript_1340:1-756(+)